MSYSIQCHCSNNMTVSWNIEKCRKAAFSTERPVSLQSPHEKLEEEISQWKAIYRRNQTSHVRSPQRVFIFCWLQSKQKKNQPPLNEVSLCEYPCLRFYSQLLKSIHFYSKKDTLMRGVYTCTENKRYVHIIFLAYHCNHNFMITRKTSVCLLSWLCNYLVGDLVNKLSLTPFPPEHLIMGEWIKLIWKLYLSRYLPSGSVLFFHFRKGLLFQKNWFS